jgi:acetyl esterase/lipase
LGRIWRLAGLLPLLFAGGCTAAQLVDALTPHSGYRAVTGQAYADGDRHSLDLYLPDKPGASRPVVVFFYGGNWQSGDKAIYRFVGQALASRGFLVVIPDYRIYPASRYPDFLVDAAKAVSWTESHARSYGGDPGQLYLMGHSAGAYIAVMLTLNRHWLARDGLDADKTIKGTIGLAGPYDFLPLTDPALQAIFGPKAQWPATQPIAYARCCAPPLLLLTGDGDETVDPGNTARLASRIRAAGGNVTEKHYAGAGHLKIIGAMASPFRFAAPTLADTLDFLNRSISVQPNRAAAR